MELYMALIVKGIVCVMIRKYNKFKKYMYVIVNYNLSSNFNAKRMS
jgi:hypothetical protein